MKPVACVILVLLSSCVSHDLPQGNSCNATNPIEDLPWLTAEIADLNDSELGKKYWFITQAVFRHQTVFIIKNCCPNCSTLPAPVYACSGQLLFRASDDQYKEIRNEKILWRPADYACTF